MSNIYLQSNTALINRLVVDPEFQGYIPALTDDEYNQLEQNIIAEGCRDPLVIWGATIIDGHNRFRICREHGIEFQVVERMFPGREAALDWMDANQLGRRSLTSAQRKILLGRRYNRLKKTRAEAGSMGGASKGQNDLCLPTTAAELARQHGVSEKTVQRAGKFAEQVETDPALVEAVAKGEVVTLRPIEPSKGQDDQKLPNEERDPDEDRHRRDYRRLSDEGREDAYVGLALDLRDAKRLAKKQAGEIRELKEQVKSFDGDQAETIRRQAAAIRHKEGEVYRANDKAMAALKQVHALKKRLSEIERAGFDV